MADISEQRESTNTMLMWGIGTAVMIVVVGIVIGYFTIFHHNVSNNVNLLNNIMGSYQKQAPSNYTL